MFKSGAPVVVGRGSAAGRADRNGLVAGRFGCGRFGYGRFGYGSGLIWRQGSKQSAHCISGQDRVDDIDR